eukprot:TRINITY_DN38914_c0_g1_i2.p1 TRINITY_DN38914_c0_g1~~TRINITY_DN38914_c0_g1_i2.p1  ORF type:complete len:162 (-),score=29.16 TRINITY_DN38914_c0_g1_i2:159-644(-)
MARAFVAAFVLPLSCLSSEVTRNSTAPPYPALTHIGVRVADGSDLEMREAKDLLFGEGPIGLRSYGAYITWIENKTYANVSFWLADDGSAFLTVLAPSKTGACVMEVDAGRLDPFVTVYQRDSFQCAPKKIADGVWEVQASGPTASCDWDGVHCTARDVVV